MNFYFPLKELPAVVRGPRVERRRVMLGGTPVWGTPCHSRSVDPGHYVECEITGIGRGGGTVVALGFNQRVPEQFKANLRMAKGGAA